MIAVVFLAAVAGIGWMAWREHVRTVAGALLAEAVAVQEARIGPPPAPGTVSNAPYFPTERERAQAALAKFKAAADAHPSTDAGIFARYKQATTLVELGNFAEAAATYQRVVEAAGSGIQGQMARLGLAEAQARGGQFDQAIMAFRELSQRKDGELPVDAILMQLGQTYLDAGKPVDAQQTLGRLVQEFPDSPFTQDAKRALDSLKTPS